MLGSALVRPLEDDWRDSLDEIARRRRWPTSREVSRLAEAVAGLSAVYNDSTRPRARLRDAGAARLGFAFPRDVPKGAGAVRELVATGVLRLGEDALRVLDVGAGLGAATWGLVRALTAAGQRGAVESTLWDDDAQALEVATEIARERSGPSSVRLQAGTVSGPLGAGLAHTERFDVILVSQVLSELDVGASDGERVLRHASLLRSLLDRHLDPHGSLVVIEPALRERTRHLHRVRDAIVLAAGATVFAPCLHGAGCPALEHEGDWCHEDLPVDLPRWLAPVARAAGLRWQGLTYSYLVLRRDSVRLVDQLGLQPNMARLRVVSDPLRSKGKREAFVCGTFPASDAPDWRGEPIAARVRATRLDRDETDENRVWARLSRGDAFALEPSPELARPRIARDSVVHRLGDAKTR